MKRYDYIVCGAGAAGLSLTLRLLRSETLKSKSILLVDRAPKTANDRTWCFWETEPDLFEPVVYRTWDKLFFRGPDGFERALGIAPYRYKMIRGKDFYEYCFAQIAEADSVEVAYGEIQSVSNAENEARVVMAGEEYRADWAFDSRYDDTAAKTASGAHYLLQHFKGWEIETQTDVFDPQVPVFMDFGIEQAGEVRFVYVLPFSKRRALVEFTVFSAALLPQAAYEAELRRYLRERLGLAYWETLHEEFGVIPMTDYAFPEATEGRIIRIGTAGGQTKASTGYTFKRVQEHSAQLVRSLEGSGSPLSHPLRRPARFQLFDSALLNVMAYNRCSTALAFSMMFRRNPAPRVLRFLDERSTLSEDLQIMSSVPTLPFMTAFFQEVFRKKA